jgi:hypothetical protein
VAHIERETPHPMMSKTKTMKYLCIDVPVECASGRVGEELGSANDICGMVTSVNWRRQALQNRGIAKAIK